MAGTDDSLIRHALTVARAAGCTELEMSIGEMEFSARLSRQQNKRKTSQSAVVAAVPTEDTIAIKSPCVGFFRGSADQLTVGSFVKKGDVVAAVVALGLANDIESAVEGEVVEVLVQSDQAVEYGQPIARVKVKK